MGKAVSKVAHTAAKPLKEFNLEQRVAKELSREKRPAAPRHQTTAHLIREAVEDQSSEVKRSLTNKDDLLYDRLKSVYVTSQDVAPVVKEHPERPLPSDRSVVHDTDFGYFEPKSVPYGKATLRTAVEAITRHQEDPVLWPARRLAMEYKLSPELTEQVLKHFRMFTVIMPPDPKEKIADSSLRQIPLTAPDPTRQLTGATLDSVGKEKGNS